MSEVTKRRKLLEVFVIITMLLSHEVQSFSLFGGQLQPMINVESTYNYLPLSAHSFRSPFYLVRKLIQFLLFVIFIDFSKYR